MKLVLSLDEDPVRRHQWQDSAACRDSDSELFFEPDNEWPVVRMRREQAAKKICAACPVRADCLRFAESGPEVFGIWGGTTQRERANGRRRRRRKPEPVRRQPVMAKSQAANQSRAANRSQPTNLRSAGPDVSAPRLSPPTPGRTAA